MQHSEAIQILQHLIMGNDPHTGQEIPLNNPIRHIKTTRALHIALKALQGLDITELLQAEVPANSTNESPVQPNWSRKALPANAGQPWTPQEDEELAGQYDSGLSILAMATLHNRSLNAIRSRLLRLGRIPLTNND